MLQTLVIALVPSIASFVFGAIIGYGRASAKLATMETNITNLQASVQRLENILLTGHS